MRVAFIFSSPHSNYTEDMLVGGLRALFGQRNVHYWPEKPQLVASVPDRLAPEGSCWLGPPSGYTQTIPDIAPYDLLLVGNPCAPGHLGYASRCLDAAQAAGVPCAVVDGEDVPNWDQMDLLFPSGPWLVREYRATANTDRALPLPFAVNTVTAPALTR